MNSKRPLYELGHLLMLLPAVMLCCCSCCVVVVVVVACKGAVKGGCLGVTLADLGVVHGCNGWNKVAAPVHQLQQYYRLGVLDNCSDKWSKLYDCLSLKTKSSSQLQEILETREKEKHHIWSFRTPEESAAKWYEWYGDLDEIE